MKKIRFGILSTAKIGLLKVIPAMQHGQHTEVAAIASRSEEKARDAARRLGIPRFYGSYDALLHDPEIDAVYIPLPNDQHVPWSIRRSTPGNTCSAKSRSVCRPTKPGSCAKRAGGIRA